MVIQSIMEDLLTTAQLARYLHLKATTVRRKAARGEIPGVYVNKCETVPSQRSISAQAASALIASL
jgi:hypothetical protein